MKFQDESLNVPGPVDQLLSDYAKRFTEIKTPRKLLWKKSLGTVKVRCLHNVILALLLGDFDLRFSIFPDSPIDITSFLYFESLFSWSCNLKIEQCNLRLRLYMQQL